MNEVTNFKYWLAGFCLLAVFIVLTFVLFFSTLGNEIKASIVTFFITVPGTLIVQYYFRKAGSNEAGPDITNNITDSSPKAPSPIGTLGQAQGWGEPCTSCGTASTSQNLAYDIPDAEEDTENLANKAIERVINDIKADGLKADSAAISSRMLSFWANHSDEFNDAEKEDFVEYAIACASAAFSGLTGLEAPYYYDDVKDYNKYWREHSTGCKVNKGAAKPLLMTLRDWLRIKKEQL